MKQQEVHNDIYHLFATHETNYFIVPVIIVFLLFFRESLVLVAKKGKKEVKA